MRRSDDLIFGAQLERERLAALLEEAGEATAAKLIKALPPLCKINLEEEIQENPAALGLVARANWRHN